MVSREKTPASPGVCVLLSVFRSKMTHSVVVVVGLTFFALPSQGQTSLHVDANASGANDGTSWCDAFTRLQDALDAAPPGTTVRVAHGVYTPSTTGLRDPREATFRLKSHVWLEGGYAGCGASDPDHRDVDLYETILSGDLNGDDVEDLAGLLACFSGDGYPYEVGCGPFDLDLDGDVDEQDGNIDNNSYHVVNGSDPSDLLLDGFTITAGNADGAYPLFSDGGGMYNEGASPTVSNCTFRANAAKTGGGMANRNGSSPTLTACVFLHNMVFNGSGGGMFNDDSSPTLADCSIQENWALNGGGMANYGGSSPTLVNCTFIGNEAYYPGVGGVGGAMYNQDQGSNPTLTDCTFTGNYANHAGGVANLSSSSPTFVNCTFDGNNGADGGAMRNGWNSNPMLVNCAFVGNIGRSAGGAIRNESSHPDLINCMFSGNVAPNGGALDNYDDSNPTLVNCTFSQNAAEYAGGGLRNSDGSAPSITNCVFWGNTDINGSGESSQIAAGSPTVDYTCVQGLTGSLGGAGNIGDDPSFVDADGPDDISGTNDDDLRLQPDSACIDTGNNDAVPPDAADLDEDGDTTEPTPLDLDGKPRFVDDPNTDDCPQPGADCGTPPIVDMGTYEFVYPCGNGVIEPGEECEPPGSECCDASCYFEFPGTSCTDDGNPCTDDVCDGAGECEHPNDDTNDCDDDEFCNGEATCRSGDCVDGADPCIDQDHCDEIDDVCLACVDDSECDDDDPCTEDACIDHECVHTPRPGCGALAYLDIKPGSCPNPVNPRSKGVVPVAIIGSESFDVTQIDIDSLLLARADGVGGAAAPLGKRRGAWSEVADVGTPFDGEPCDCHELGADGIDDLLLKFSTPELAEVLELGSLPRGTSVALTLSGSLLDGTGFEASDCIVIPGKDSSAGLRGMRR